MDQRLMDQRQTSSRPRWVAAAIATAAVMFALTSCGGGEPERVQLGAGAPSAELAN